MNVGWRLGERLRGDRVCRYPVDPARESPPGGARAAGAEPTNKPDPVPSRSRCIACTPEVARPYGILGIMPFVRSPRTPGIPYLRLLLFVQKCHAKVSALELRFLVDQGARREFTQFLPQPPQVHTNSARNSSVPARFRTSEKRMCSQEAFVSISFVQVLDFLSPLEISRVYNPIRSHKRTQGEPGRRLASVHAPIRPTRPRLPFVAIILLSSRRDGNFDSVGMMRIKRR